MSPLPRGKGSRRDDRALPARRRDPVGRREPRSPNTDPTMTRESFADLLFFTRAAVRRDPALANARLAGEFAEWGVLRVNGYRSDKGEDDPPLTLGGLIRAWEDPDILRVCPSCLAPVLFLRGGGGGMLHWVFSCRWLCPFCGRADERKIHGISEGEKYFVPIRTAFRRHRRAAAAEPDGLPFAEALFRLRALRDADLLNPSHPLEKESVAQVPLALHALQDHPPGWLEARRRNSRRAAAVRDARIRAELATLERVAAARERLPALLARQEEACKALAAELASLRASPGEAGPKARLRSGELAPEDFRAIQARKRELVAALRPARLAADRAAALSRELEAELGRALSADEQRVFLEAVEGS